MKYTEREKMLMYLYDIKHKNLTPEKQKLIARILLSSNEPPRRQLEQLLRIHGIDVQLPDE